MKKQLASKIKTDRLTMLQCLSNEKDIVKYNIYTDEDYIGALILYFDDDEKLLEPDIIIESDYRCSGYALEAMDAVLNEIVITFPKYELVAAVAAENKAGNCLCKRLDFTLDFRDELCNDNIYTM